MAELILVSKKTITSIQRKVITATTDFTISSNVKVINIKFTEKGDCIIETDVASEFSGTWIVKKFPNI